jgi:hypothetical protein
MKNKEILIGAIVGVVTTIIGILLYMMYKAYAGNLSLGIVWDHYILSSHISTAMAWGTALNFAAFFGFLKLNKEDRAQGVLIITVAVAVFVMIHKLLS